MRRTCYLLICTVYLITASILLLRAAYASAPDTKAAPRRGIAVLASSIGGDYSPEGLANLVQQWKFSPVVIDWAWITAHWDQTNFTALNHFIELMAARGVPVAAMYRPRFLNNPTVPIQVDRAGKPAASHGSYICFSSPEARQWGISWGTRILQQCPRINEIIIYNPLNQCQCPACLEAARNNPYAHYDAVWQFLAEAKAAWQGQNAGAKLGVVFVNDPEFWRRGAQVLDVAHPFLFITDDTDMAKDAAEASAIRDLLPGKMGFCLAKITWGPNDKVSPSRLAEFDKSAAEAGLPYFFWTVDTLFDSSLYDQQAVAQILRENPLASHAQAVPTIPPQQEGSQPGNYSPDLPQAAAALLKQIMEGPDQIAAVDSLVKVGRQSDAEGRRAIISAVAAAMNDKRWAEYPRWLCCKVLGGIADERAVPDLIQVLLHEESEIVRYVAAEVVGEFYKNAKSTAAHEGLLQAAGKETSSRVRETLARYLRQEMPAAPPSPAAAGAVEAQTPTGTPQQGISQPGNYSLDAIRRTSAQVFLERMVSPEAGYQQFAAMNALIQKAKESDAATRGQILSLVTATMNDSSRPFQQRWQCCKTLGAIGDTRAVPALIQLLQPYDSGLSGFAAEALADFSKNAKSATAHNALLQAARYSPAIQEVVARRLGEEVLAADGSPAPAGVNSEYTSDQIRRISTEVFLKRMLYPEPNCDNFAAMNALIEKAKESDQPAKDQILSLVIEAMRDKSHPADQRWQCCYVLSGCGDELAVPHLIQVLLNDESDAMRAVAAEALADFPKSAAAHDALLQAARQETSQTVREVLTRRLGQAMPAPLLVPAATPFAVEERAPSGAPQPPPAPRPPVTKPLPWPFPGNQENQNIFNNYQQATDIYIHCGLDFIQPAGTPVTAVDSGYVATVYTNYPDWITHYFFIVTPKQGGNVGWCYTHLDPHTFTFKEGDFIRQGQKLGSLVDFSVGNQPGVAHLHLHYVSFTRDASGKVNVHSLIDPLYFFDCKDTEPPVFQPLRFVRESVSQQFQADAAGVVTVSGRVDILAAVTDSAFPGHMGNLGVPVVMFSISDGTHTMQKLVVDHRGDVGDETRVKPLYLSYNEKKAFFNPDSFPRYQMLRVTKTDGDGRITPRDAMECWDTTARDRSGKSLWPDGQYSVNVYAWDIAGNQAIVGATVQVKNR